MTNPKKALYNRVYYRTSKGCVVIPGLLGLVMVILALGIMVIF